MRSDPDTVTVSTVNVPPNADAGSDQGVVVGDLVIFDGSGSNDPDGDSITYLWSISNQPGGSLTTLSGANTASPSLVPDLPGAYTVQLVVNDGSVDSAPDVVTISVITAEVTAETNTTDALNIVAALPPGDVTTKGNQQALIQTLLKVLDSLQDGDIDAAKKKLKQAIERTDGCALRGSPDMGGGGGGLYN